MESLQESYSPTLIGEFPGKLYGGRRLSKTDLETIHEMGIQTIVCLLERQFPNPEEYKNHEFKVIHFPIVDYNCPKDGEKFHELIVEIIVTLKIPNNKILVHCHGGRGRTGLVLACVIKGITQCDGEEAINKIREKIFNAVETREQENFVRDFVYIPPITPMPLKSNSSNNSKLNVSKYLTCFFGSCFAFNWREEEKGL